MAELFGEYYPEAREKVLVNVSKPVCYSIPDNILKEMWWKFMLNVGINQTLSHIKGFLTGV